MVRLLLLTTVTLAGCGVCDCREPTGPRFDAEAARADVERVFGGAFTGEVTDTSEPWDCGDEGSPYTLTIAIDAPQCLDEDTQDASCGAVKRASYPITATIAVDGGEATFEGAIDVWSLDDGLALESADVRAEPSDYPIETLGLRPTTPLLDDASLADAQWDRRLSNDDEAALWDSCLLPTAR